MWIAPWALTQAALENGAGVLDAGTDPARYTEVALDAPDASSHSINSAVLDADVVAQFRQIARIHFLWCDIAVRNSEAGQAKHGRSHDCF